MIKLLVDTTISILGFRICKRKYKAGIDVITKLVKVGRKELLIQKDNLNRSHLEIFVIERILSMICIIIRTHLPRALPFLSAKVFIFQLDKSLGSVAYSMLLALL